MFAFSLSGCSGGGLAGDIVTGRVIGGEDKAQIQLSTSSTSIEAEGGRISVEISNTGDGEMNWSASLNSTWAKIEGDANGEGRKTLTVVFEGNTQASERTVVLSVTSEDASNTPQTVTFSQAAAEPEPEPAPSLQASADYYTVSADGGTITVELTNEGGGELNWSATLPSDASWVRFLGKNAGRGDSSIQIEVDTNPTAERRSFQLTVTAEEAEQSPQTLNFSQEQGTEVQRNSLAASAASYDIDSGGATVQVRVTAGDSVAWTATLGDDIDWAHFSGPSGGAGDGSVTLRVDSNDGPDTRSLELTVAADSDSGVSRTLSFVQEAGTGPSADSIRISAASYDIDTGGATVQVSVTAGDSVAWTATLGDDIDWAHFSGPSSETGGGSVTLRVDPNALLETRSFELTVAADSGSGLSQSLSFVQEAGTEPSAESIRISAASYDIDSGGATVQVTVTAGNSVAWTATLGGDIDWAHFSGPSSGTGGGSLSLRVDPNALQETRSFELTVAADSGSGLSQSLSFVQEARTESSAESIQISAASYGIESGGATVQVTVTAGDSVAWTATLGDDIDWAHFSGPSSGTGGGSLTLRVDPNALQETRSFELTVAADSGSGLSQSLSFVQEAGTEPSAESIRISAASYDVDSGGATVQVTVTAGDSIAWTATIGSNVDWARFSGPSSGTGDGSVTIRVDANTLQETRSLRLTVAASGESGLSQTLSFVQEAGTESSAESLRISAASYDVDSGGATVQVSVTAGDSVAWTAAIGGNIDWAHFSGPSGGTGDGSVTLRIDPNARQETRSFELTVAADSHSGLSQSLSFVQEAGTEPSAESIRISAASYDIDSGGATVQITVTAGDSIAWTATIGGNVDWARFSGPSSGTADGSVTIRVDANTLQETRSLRLTVAASGESGLSQTLSFVQEAGTESSAESIRISAASYDIDSGGATVEVTVTAGDSVAWTAAIGGNIDWAHFSGPSGGTGDGSVTLRINPNARQETRSFELTVAADADRNLAQTLSFVQEAAVSPVLAVSAVPADRSIPHTGGTVRVDVSNRGAGRMDWTASTGAAWAAVAGSPSGTNSGSVIFSVLQNEGQARAFTVTVQAGGAENSPRFVTFTQEAAPERARDSARIHANKYSLSHLGETVTVNIEVSGEAQLNWSANILRAHSTYSVFVPELDEDGNATGRSIEETRDRGEWVRVLGNSGGTGSGTLQLQIDRNPVPLRWSFSLGITFPDAPELDQTLHFSQDYQVEQRLTLWAASRLIGAGGESVEVHLNASSGGLVYWVASVDAEWAHLEGAVSGEIDGNGSTVIHINVDANPGEERSFNLTVEATNARTSQSLAFRQAAPGQIEGGVPMPPPPPAWYSNDCQRQTPGFEEFGGWLAERGNYLNASDSRVWRHMTDGHASNEPTLRAFTDCTEDSRTLTTSILADALLDQPAEFSNLPVGADVRIVLLDTVIPNLGEHRNGARHEDPAHVWSDAGSGWYPTFTQDGSGAKFLHLQPLGDWGYNSSSGWRGQVSEWNAEGSDMSAWTDTARQYGWRLPSIQERTGEGLRQLANADTSLWLLVGGYTGTGSGRRIHPNSAVCGEARRLCLFAPWEYRYTDAEGAAQVASGTAVAAAQVAAALDNVLLLWPDYDLLDLRDLVLGCAEDLGDEGPDAMWGRGVLSFNCLFTAQGDLRDPRTNTILSGGIYGPLQGLGHRSSPALFPAGGGLSGIDLTGREFSYPLLRWTDHENHALLVASGVSGDGHTNASPLANPGHNAELLHAGPFSARIAAAGDAVGAVAQWRAGGLLTDSGLWTLRGGLALQQEGAGSLQGERVFRAPATLSSSFSVAFQHDFTSRLSLHFQGNYWVTLNTMSRSLWAGAQLSELRASAALAYRSGKFTAVMQAQYGGGLSGRLDVAGRTIRLTPNSARNLSLRIRIPFRAPRS